MYLSGCQMGQSPMGLKMNLERRRRVQFGIFLNQGVGFEYTQLLPGFEMIQLILGAKRTPLMSRAVKAPLCGISCMTHKQA